MAADWLPMRLDLAEDPATMAIAEATGLDVFAVVGRLHRLWSWANQQLTDGHARSVTLSRLDALVGVTGFAQAMAEADWLQVDEGGVTFPNFERWNSQGAKRRLLAARRQQCKRSRSERDKSVTKEEKRREEKNTPLTPLGGEAVEIPAPLDTPAFRKAWAEWKANRSANRVKPYKPRGEQTQLNHLATFGPSVAIAAIEQSIRQGWQGLFPERVKEQHAPRGDPVTEYAKRTAVHAAGLED